MDTTTSQSPQTDPENCNILAFFEIISGKWKPAILYHLIHNDKLRFSELQRRIPGITQKMLTQQLKALEKDNLINRKAYPVVPPKVEYSTTKKGESLDPIFRSMKKWWQENAQ